MTHLDEAAIFNVARRMKEPAARSLYIQQACGLNAALQARIEALLRVYDQDATFLREWEGRAHFFAAAAESMRRILVEKARRRRRHKHGGGLPRVDVGLANTASPMPDEDLLALDEAMSRLAEEDAVRARLVQLRFYAGLSNEEAAQVLGISAVTTKRYWRYARAWLHREVGKGDGTTPAPEDRAARKSRKNLIPGGAFRRITRYPGNGRYPTWAPKRTGRPPSSMRPRAVGLRAGRRRPSVR